MSNVVTVATQSRLAMPSGMPEIDAGKWRVLCESVFPNAKSAESIVLALDYCKVRKLDPFKRPVNIVPMWNKSLGKEVETIWPGINEVQTTAARTGKYAGMDEPKWGQDKIRTFEGVSKWKDGNAWKEENLKVEVTYPEWCSVTVYRMVEGQRCAFTEPVFWEEAYGKRGKTEVPNDMWTKRSRGQLLKVAKAFSLRAAFPEEGEYTAEEMEGKEIAAGGVVIENTEQPNHPPVFRNSSLRNTFCKNVIQSFENAKGVAELNEAFSLNVPKLTEMKASGNEHDELAAEELHKRYKQQLIRLKDFVPEEDSIDDVPAYLRQQMEEERERNSLGMQY